MRLNGERVKPGARIKAGDRLLVVRQQVEFDLTVTDLPTRRGPARAMVLCYDEDPASVAKREQLLAQIRADRQQMPTTSGRPDKHTRRALRSRKVCRGS